ncbi:MAG: Hpt domain-containing protein, partial [Spirochaetes bacterium]|nr:Hpt domain-containing protein [Spirochaetota bacterium]
MVHIDEKRFQRAFLEEVLELLESLNEKLLLLEHSPEDVDIINEIFRLTHSIKSESSLIGFMNISTIAHKMEDIFERVRRGALLVDTEIMNTLFASYDMIIELITAVQNNKDESLFDISDVVKRLSNVLKEDVDLSEEKENGKLETKTAKESPQNKEDEDKLIVNKTIIKKIDINFSDFEKNQIEDGLEKGETFYRIVFYLTDDCEMRYPRVYLVYNNFVSAGTVVKTIPDVLLEAADEKFSRVELYLLSNLKLDSLKKCADVDQVKKIDIGKIELIALKYSGMDLSNVSGYTEMLLSQEQIEEGEQIEREWQKQYESDLGKEKEKGVADTSTVEIRNEEIKKILTKDEKKDKLKAIQREMV